MNFRTLAFEVGSFKVGRTYLYICISMREGNNSHLPDEMKPSSQFCGVEMGLKQPCKAGNSSTC